jgi:hypothetical protein
LVGSVVQRSCLERNRVIALSRQTTAPTPMWFVYRTPRMEAGGVGACRVRDRVIVRLL